MGTGADEEDSAGGAGSGAVLEGTAVSISMPAAIVSSAMGG